MTIRFGPPEGYRDVWKNRDLLREKAVREQMADRLEQAIRGWARNRMREPLREIIEEALRG